MYNRKQVLFSPLFKPDMFISAFRETLLFNWKHKFIYLNQTEDQICANSYAPDHLYFILFSYVAKCLFEILDQFDSCCHTDFVQFGDGK